MDDPLYFPTSTVTELNAQLIDDPVQIPRGSHTFHVDRRRSTVNGPKRPLTPALDESARPRGLVAARPPRVAGGAGPTRLMIRPVLIAQPHRTP